jgi:hypothetical protein
MVDCAKGGCAAWHSRSALAGVQPQPRRRSLEPRDVALTPLAPGQQLGRLGRRHPEGLADVRGLGNAALVQLVANRHTQADRRQPVLLPNAPFLGGHLRLLRRRWWRRLVKMRAHVSMVGRAVAGVIPTLPRWSFTV